MVNTELENFVRQGVVTYRGGKRGYKLKDLKINRPTLDEIFIKITKENIK